MSLWVVDASTLIAGVITEPLTERAHDFLRSEGAFMAPITAVPECANALLKKVRGEKLPVEVAQGALHDLGRLPIEYINLRGFESLSLFEAARSAGVTAHDAVYLLLAESRDARVVSADKKFLRSASATPRWKKRVIALAEWTVRT